MVMECFAPFALPKATPCAGRCITRNFNMTVPRCGFLAWTLHRFRLRDIRDEQRRGLVAGTRAGAMPLD